MRDTRRDAFGVMARVVRDPCPRRLLFARFGRGFRPTGTT